MRRKALIAVGLVITLALVGWQGPAWVSARGNEPVEVTGVTVTRGTIAASVEATAFVEAQTEFSLAAPVSGRVTTAPLDAGQRVKRNQVLAQFDAAEADERIRAAEAALATADSRVQQAERNYQAEKAIWEAGGQTRQAVDEVLTNLRAEQAQRDRTRADLNATRIQRNAFTLRAPKDGIITATEVRQGEYALVGAPVLRMASLQQLEVQLKIDQSVADMVKIGQPVKLIAESSTTEFENSRITRIEPKIRKEGSSYYLVAWAPLPDNTKLGNTLSRQFSARIETASHENVLRVPLDAVTEKNRIETARIVEDGRLRLQPLKTGIQDEHYIEVLDGLSEGQIVLLGNFQKPLREGMPVRLAPPPTKP